VCGVVPGRGTIRFLQRGAHVVPTGYSVPQPVGKWPSMAGALVMAFVKGARRRSHRRRPQRGAAKHDAPSARGTSYEPLGKVGRLLLRIDPVASSGESSAF
jgi:hypothetical protein